MSHNTHTYSNILKTISFFVFLPLHIPHPITLLMLYIFLFQKQLTIQELEEPLSYPTTTSLPRQSSIGTSGVTASASVKSKSAQSNHTPSPAAATTNGHGKSVSPSSSNTSNNNSKSKTKGIYILLVSLD